MDISNDVVQKWQAVLKAHAEAQEASTETGGMNKRSKYDRLGLGKGVEKALFEYLVAVGVVCREASQQRDMVDKVDLEFCLSGNGYPDDGQFKVRLDGKPDVLVEVFRPYCGLHHPSTRPGRDFRSTVDIYISLINGVVYFSSGHGVKRLVNRALREWEEDECPIIRNTWTTADGMIQLKFTQDKGEDDGGDRKMMAFLKPELLLKEGIAFKYNPEYAALPAYKDGLQAILKDVLAKWNKKHENQP